MNQKVTASDNALNLGKSIPETILRLSAPAILEQFLVCLASLIDTAMVGSIGAAATASVAINISTIWLVNSFITALSVGFSFLVSHSVGEGNRRKTESAVRQSILASVLLGLLLTICVFVIHSELPRLLGAAPDVLPNAQAYLGILSLGLVPQTLGVVLSAVFRSAGNTKIPLAVNLTSNLLNVIGNFLLIYPARQISLPGFSGWSATIWGAGWGIRGAAVSTALSQYALAILCLYHIFCSRTAAQISVRGDYRFQRQSMRTLLRITVPVLLERNTLCLGQVALTAMISGLGTQPLAAHYLTNQTEGLLYLPAYGFSYTATTLIGQSLGARNKTLANRFARDICIIGSTVIVAACVPVFLLARPIISLFTTDGEVLALGTQTLKIAAATEVFFSFFVICCGISRGAGDVRFPLAVSIIGMWGFRIGLVWIATRVLLWGVAGVWIAIAVDCFVRACLFLYRLRSGKWMQASVA